MNLPETIETKNKYSFEKKWSSSIAKHGYTEVPNLILQYQPELKMTTPELRTLIAILSFKWDSKNPWPSNSSIGKRANTTSSTVRKHVSKLEEKGLLRRIGRRGFTNKYDVSPLKEKLEELAKLPTPVEQDSLDSPAVIEQGDEAILTPKEDTVKEEYINKPEVAEGNAESLQIRQVYEFFLKCFNKTPAQCKLTDSRKGLIKARLEDAGFEMLMRAIESTSQNEFYLGDNPSKWTADIDYIIRNYEQVERLSNLLPSKDPKQLRREKIFKERQEEFLRRQAEENNSSKNAI